MSGIDTIVPSCVGAPEKVQTKSPNVRCIQARVDVCLVYLAPLKRSKLFLARHYVIKSIYCPTYSLTFTMVLVICVTV